MLKRKPKPSLDELAVDLQQVNLAKEASLMDLLTQSGSLSSQLYLVFDVAKDASFWSNWHVLAHQYPEQWQYLYHDTPMSYLNDLSPLVIQVIEGGFGDALLQEALQNDTPDWGFLCVSPVALTSLLEHWQAWMSVYLPGNSETLLRFYEPKILKLMLCHPSFDDEDSAKLLGPCLAIYLQQVSNAKFVQQMINPPLIENVMTQAQQPVSIDNLLPLAPWFYMDPEQVEAINHLFYHTRLTELAVELYKLAPGKCQTLSHGATLMSLDRGIQLATKIAPKGSARAKEQFALLRFIIGSEFYLHPRFIAFMKELPLQYALKRFYDTPNYHQQVSEQYHTDDWMTLDADAISVGPVQVPLIQQGCM